MGYSGPAFVPILIAEPFGTPSWPGVEAPTVSLLELYFAPAYLAVSFAAMFVGRRFR
jgi:hypothetical protein